MINPFLAPRRAAGRNRFRPGPAAAALVLAAASLFGVSAAQPPSARPSLAPPPVTSATDDYTRYELLAPETASFRIVYEVTATAPGARFFFNAIRKGSVASGEAVFDRMTGEPLTFDIVTGAEARAAGEADADPATSYIRVRLARPVPANGEVRLRIDKTYKDPASYFREGDRIVFSRSLGIRRNAVVLPAGYELVSCNYPSQVLPEPDGRLAVSFINVGPGAVPFVIAARPLPQRSAR
jgi:hypothetical protein